MATRETLGVLLVPLSGALGDARALGCALRLAKAHPGTVVDALIAAAVLAPMPILAGVDGLIPFDPLQSAMNEIERARRQHARDNFQQLAQTATDIARLLEDAQPLGEALSQRALLADYVLLPGPVDQAPGVDPLLLQTVLFDCGRPLLLAAGQSAAADAPVLVAWNGGAEAARAISAAKPMLSGCSEVVIAQVGAGATLEALAPVLDYLERHGVGAQPRVLAGSGGHAGAALLEEAQRLGAGLLVMGAYGHGRARQLIFGGTTRHVIDHARLDVLLAH
ncbi:MAG: universal stress protein [Gammaproteobacteria bacterium]|nr:universal stress protein [Gammaproteobacteria bacterium]